MKAASGISSDDRAALRKAADALEYPGLAARMSSVLGMPIEEGLKLLPRSWHDRLNRSTHAALGRALDVAVSTLPDAMRSPDFDRRHRNLSALTGAAGGIFGLPGTLLELPFTTLLMLRAIAAIAEREGEDLDSIETRLSCVEVFALSGPCDSDDAAETGYYGLRMMMAYHFATVGEALARHGVAAGRLPAVVAFLRAVAARFGVVVSEKAAFAAIPVFGAAGGALVNAVFMDHFQRIARGHFLVRRLERKYGRDTIRQAYEAAAGAAVPPGVRTPLAARPA
jgi:hypothetical protein